jgi:hypothetical protein
MNHHWEHLSVDQLALFEEGATQTRWTPMRGFVAQIIKLGPYAGGGAAKYRADGPLVDPSQDFDTEAEAINAVEETVRVRGGTVNWL